MIDMLCIGLIEYSLKFAERFFLFSLGVAELSHAKDCLPKSCWWSAEQVRKRDFSDNSVN